MQFLHFCALALSTPVLTLISAAAHSSHALSRPVGSSDLTESSPETRLSNVVSRICRELKSGHSLDLSLTFKRKGLCLGQKTPVPTLLWSCKEWTKSIQRHPEVLKWPIKHITVHILPVVLMFWPGVVVLTCGEDWRATMSESAVAFTDNMLPDNVNGGGGGCPKREDALRSL